jgi:hypothetical protein
MSHPPRSEARTRPAGVYRTEDAVEPAPQTLPEPGRPTAPAPEPRLAVEKLAYRLNSVAELLDISRRLLERERAAGRFPPPDKHIGKCPVWTRDTLRAYLAEGDRR